MNEKYIEESLNNLRMTKILLWNTLIVAIGGDIGLFLKALNTKNPIFEWIFVVLGLFLICILINFIDKISFEISKLINQLKNTGGQ